MSETSTVTRPRSARTAIVVALVLAALCAGGILVWQNYGRPSAGVQPSDETKPALNSIEQTVKDLQASQQQTANQLSEIKKELAAEQEERKMLSEQIGALASRVDSLAAAPSSAVAKKKR